MVVFEALHNKIYIQKFESYIERHCRLFCNVISTTTNQYHEGHIKCLLWFQQLKAWTVNFQDISPLLLYCCTTIISFSWPPTNTLNGLTCTFPSHPLNSICGGFSIPLWIFFPSLGHVKKSTAIKHYSTANFRVMFSLSSRRAKPAECSSTAQNGCQQQAKQLKDIHEPWIFFFLFPNIFSLEKQASNQNAEHFIHPSLLRKKHNSNILITQKSNCSNNFVTNHLQHFTVWQMPQVFLGIFYKLSLCCVFFEPFIGVISTNAPPPSLYFRWPKYCCSTFGYKSKVR